MHLWITSLFFESSSLDLGELQEMVRDKEACHAAAHGLTESDTTGRLRNKSWLEADQPADKNARAWLGFHNLFIFPNIL